MNNIQNIAQEAMLLGVSQDSIIHQIENYQLEIKKITDWELDLELIAQAEARLATRRAIYECSEEDLPHIKLDYTLILFRISACAQECKRRFIP